MARYVTLVNPAPLRRAKAKAKSKAKVKSKPARRAKPNPVSRAQVKPLAAWIFKALKVTGKANVAIIERAIVSYIFSRRPKPRSAYSPKMTRATFPYFE